MKLLLTAWALTMLFAFALLAWAVGVMSTPRFLAFALGYVLCNAVWSVHLPTAIAAAAKEAMQ